MTSIRLPGISAPIRVASAEEAEQAAFVVCMPLGSPTPFYDNVTATCSDCRCLIIHRPHAPKKPPKICIDCVALRAQGGEA
jgi:hypothetical protein